MSDNQFEGMTVLQVIATVEEYQAINEFLNDDRMTRALELLAIFYANGGDIPYAKAAKLIIELQALSTDFAAKAVFYQTIGKEEYPDATARKNIYYAMRDALGKLSDSIKYMLR